MQLHGTASLRSPVIPGPNGASSRPPTLGTALRADRSTGEWAPSRPSGTGRAHPRVIEIIGPAGAGKSTLTAALHACHPSATTTELSLWNLPRSLLLASAAALTPSVTRAALAYRAFDSSELRQMLRMGALRRAVQRTRRRPTGLVVLDEGPVFGLTWLDVFFSRKGHLEWVGWRHDAVQTWAQCIDAIVWVDADDATLIHRIRTRAKPHPVKEATDHEIRAFTACFRAAFKRVVQDLSNAQPLRVMNVRTDEVTPDAMAVRLRAALNGSIHGR